MKHQIVFVLLVLLCPFGLRAQVVIDQTFSIEEYVNDVLLGTGVTASNITYIGDPVQPCAGWLLTPQARTPLKPNRG